MIGRGARCGAGLCLFALLLILQGCSTLGYYSQSVGGHLQLMGQRRPIVQLLQDPETSESLKRKLQQIDKIRTFASVALVLPENGSYRSYAALDREAVVWSVVAAPEFSMQPRQWCYLIIGCASYRGYFSREQAEAYVGELRVQGLDVALEPVPAYSTLGWFDDPLPSTVINWPEPRIAGLIFHELAHQQLYIKGDSAFNEAFANLVEQVGVERWLAGEDAAQRQQWRQFRKREQQFIKLLLDTREALVMLYRRQLTATVMRRRKAMQFQQLQHRYRQLKQQWGGYAGFDGWFDRGLNNAHLASVATYEEWVPVFQWLLDQAGGDLPNFYRASQALGQLPDAERQERLSVLRQEAQMRGHSAASVTVESAAGKASIDPP